MPYTSREKKNEAQRRWYYNHRKERIAQITKRKREEYGGKCVVCGAVTLGQSKKHPGSDYCYKHRSEQWEAKKNAGHPDPAA